MTNFKFRLSGIVPNAWFCKLKEMSKSRKSRSSGHQQKSNRLEPFKIIQPTQDSAPQKEALLPNRASYYLSSRAKTEAETDSQRKKSSTKSSNSPSHESPKLQLQLPPIMTKKVRADAKAQGTRKQSQIQRLRMRASSPRVAANKKLQLARNSVSSQKGGSRSFAVVKSSTNPGKDFRDSMVEMIREYGITTSKELEDLLACYLLLNANVHHDVIVKVFQQVCFHHTGDS